MASPYWKMVKDCNFDEVPDTYLDWLLDQAWFQKMLKLYASVQRELATRKRSHYHIEDRFGKTLED